VLPGSADLDVRDRAQVARRLRGAVSSKVHGYEDLLTGLVAEACIDVAPENPANFNVDNVRIAKLMGGALPDSHIVRVRSRRRRGRGRGRGKPGYEGPPWLAQASWRARRGGPPPGVRPAPLGAAPRPTQPPPSTSPARPPTHPPTPRAWCSSATRRAA
jgi:hypothetical protein